MLSICIITKNECEKLRACLDAIRNLNVEIVVVDTGSEDDSISIAKNVTESVYTFAWCDDFAAARNYAAGKAKNDLIMMLDTDEILTKIELQQLERMMLQNIDKVGRLHRKNPYKTDGLGMSSNELVNRIYNRNYFEYEGIIHEQLVSKDHNNYQTYVTPVYIDHSGYIGADDEKDLKAERNLKLLFKALEKDPRDPYILYQIGKSYYYRGNYAEAVEYFANGLDYATDCRLEYVLDMVNSFGYALLHNGNVQDALMLQNLYEDFCWSADYLFMLGNVLLQNAIFDKAIDMLRQATYVQNCTVEGVNSYLAYYNIGVIYECTGHIDKARQYYLKCGTYNLASEALKRINNLK